MRRPGPAAALCFGAALIAVLPVLLPNEYYLTVLIVAGLNGMIALGLNLLMGYAGQISLGHAAFYGMAAYATGILTATYHWPVPLGMAAGVALVLAVAALIAVPTLRLKGHYLAMGTLGFGLIVYIVLNEATALTGGPSGLGGIPRLSVFGRPLSADLAYFYVVWAAVLLCFGMAGNLVRSRLGRALRAIHTSETAAAALGIDTERTKIGVFILSAGTAAIAGVLNAHYVRFVSPGTFGFTASVQFVTMVVLGGMGSLWGGLAGAVVLTVLPEALRALEDYDILVYGLLLILCMMYLPGGLVEGVDRLGRHVSAARLRLARRKDPA